MTDLEKQAIDLIQNNRYLSEELKKRYTLSLFMMNSDQQKQYFMLLQGFSRRCSEVDRGLFILRADEAGELKTSFDEVKRDILKKMQEEKRKQNNQ